MYCRDCYRQKQDEIKLKQEVCEPVLLEPPAVVSRGLESWSQGIVMLQKRALRGRLTRVTLRLCRKGTSYDSRSW